MLASTFLFALMNVCIKQISHLPATEVIVFRSIISLIISWVVLYREKVPLLGNNRKVLLLRGVFGGISLLMYFTTIQQIPLASAQTLQYLSPIFTAVFAIFIVKEKLSPLQLAFLLLSLLGVFLIQGFDSRVSIFYAVLGIVAAAFAGLAYNCIRKLKTTEHPMVIIFYFPLVCLPIAAVWSCFNWVKPVGWDWLFLILVGVFTQMAQYFMTKAYQAEVLAKIAPLNYIGIIYALVFGFVFFDEGFNFISLSGMALVGLGVVLNLRFKPRQPAERITKVEKVYS